jgi:hypothetical protein
MVIFFCPSNRPQAIALYCNPQRYSHECLPSTQGYFSFHWHGHLFLFLKITYKIFFSYEHLFHISSSSESSQCKVRREAGKPWTAIVASIDSPPALLLGGWTTSCLDYGSRGFSLLENQPLLPSSTSYNWVFLKSLLNFFGPRYIFYCDKIHTCTILTI